jgi:hypothetical protein
MIRLFATLTFFAAIACSSLCFAQKESDDEPSFEERMAKIVKLGPGVHKIEKDKKGRITSCIVVGQARISTSLGKAKGIELARDKANLVCSAEFVKWLKEEVAIYSSNDDETVILMDGEESEEADSIKESSKSVEKSSKKMESLSKGLVRGLQVLHKEVEGDGKTYTIVKGWKADNAEGVKKISANVASDEPNEKGGKKDSAANKSGKQDKKIDSESVTSEEASDYFPKKKKK